MQVYRLYMINRDLQIWQKPIDGWMKLIAIVLGHKRTRGVEQDGCLHTVMTGWKWQFFVLVGSGCGSGSSARSGGSGFGGTSYKDDGGDRL
ncbi:hypothetical protein L3X38_006628 [Prunus dulcis]|uniref:Uncharacterized protein n=1 Tax=Prunus dulcis TaxID=3755 RepID=A0AAD5F596_PRUDU|nr:hypothetical protein L3X38_006628 [Prunus dulcis]